MTDQAMPQSPFLPGTKTQFAWDSTSLGALKTCPRYYQYTMLDGYVAKDENIHLRFGQEYHSAIQDYENCRAGTMDFEDAVRETVHRLLVRINDWDVDHTHKPGSYKNARSLLFMVVSYLDEYRNDPCKTLILDNGKPAVELSFRFELDWGPFCDIGRADIEGREKEQPYLLCGHLDRVVTFNDDIYVMDRKTTTSTPGDYYFDQFEPNNQMTLYTLASQVIFQSPIKGVIIDAAQIAIDFSRFTRGFTYRTPEQISEWMNDLKFWFAKAEDYAAEGYWPMNDTACGNYGGCRFRKICSKSPQVREQFLKSNFTKQEPHERWNPLKSRER